MMVLCSSCAQNGHAPYKMEFEKDDHGNHPGCSWYCCAPPISVEASSFHKDALGEYKPEHAHDVLAKTAWVEGVKGDGIGERITFVFDKTGVKDDGEKYGLESASIINGFAQSESLWKANNRVKTLRVFHNGKYRGQVTLEDTMKPQIVEFPKMDFYFGKKTRISFEIASVYKGEKYDDTAIADFFFSGYGPCH